MKQINNIMLNPEGAQRKEMRHHFHTWCLCSIACTHVKYTYVAFKLHGIQNTPCIHLLANLVELSSLLLCGTLATPPGCRGVESTTVEANKPASCFPDFRAPLLFYEDAELLLLVQSVTYPLQGTTKSQDSAERSCSSAFQYIRWIPIYFVRNYYISFFS